MEAMEDASEEEIEDVEEVKDDNSDIQVVEQEDPLDHLITSPSPFVLKILT